MKRREIQVPQVYACSTFFTCSHLHSHQAKPQTLRMSAYPWTYLSLPFVAIVAVAVVALFQVVGAGAVTVEQMAHAKLAERTAHSTVPMVVPPLFDRQAFAEEVHRQILNLVSRRQGQRRGEGSREGRGGDMQPGNRQLLFLDISAAPKKPFASITPACQRMQNYYFSTCVYAPPMLRTNDPHQVPLGERR